MFSKAKDPQQAPPIKDKDKDKADLIWFEYETRLRKLVEELLEPTVKRSREEREMYEVLSKKHEGLLKRVEDLEFTSHRTQKRQTVFEDIFRRISELDQTRKADEKVLMDHIQNVKKMVEELQTDMYMLKGNMEELDRKAVKLSQEYITTCDNMAEYKTNIFKVIDDLKLELKTTSDSQASMNKDMTFRIGTLETTSTEIKETLKQHGKDIGLTKNRVERLTNKSEILEENLKSNTELLNSCAAKVSALVGFKSRIDDLETQVRLDENYIEKYLPVYMQIQIADSIHNSLPASQKKKHALFEQKKLQDLIDQLKTENRPMNLIKKIDRVFSIVEPTIKSYAEEYLKVKYDGDKAIDMDEDSDLDQSEAAQIERLGKRLALLKSESEKATKTVRDELLRKFNLLSKDQVEMKEGLSNKIKDVVIEVGEIIEGKVSKLQEDQVQMAETIEKNIKEKEESMAQNPFFSTNSQHFGGQPQPFFKCLSEIIATLIEATNGILATLLKEEKEREILGASNAEREDKPQGFSQMVKDIVQKKKSTESRSSKEDLLEQRDTVNNPVNITQENSIMKLEFLLAVFENFKSCLIFSTKYRVSTDFNQFFESESLRVNQLLERSMRKETSQNLHQSRLKTGEDSLRERGGSPQVRSGKLLTNVSHKSLASEANSMNAAAEKKQTTQPAPESQNNIKNE